MNSRPRIPLSTEVRLDEYVFENFATETGEFIGELFMIPNIKYIKLNINILRLYAQ